MALPWWLATTACASPPPGPGSFTDALVFLFLSPCPQRLLLAAVDLVFLVACLVHLARRCLRRGQGHPGPAAAPLSRTRAAAAEAEPSSFAAALPLPPVTGFTGHGSGAQEGEAEHTGTEDPPSSPYAAASFLSRATFSWINSLINKGYAADSLKTEDVPPVSAGHRAEAAYTLFMSNWPASPGSRHPVGVSLWLSFWPQLVLTAFHGLARLGAMYVGPSLIDRFVEFIRRGGTPWEGLRLVLILLSGKAVQTLASHHYSFQGQLLGMRIRGALQTALYRKSLRLTASARRAHGAGAIVNYMQVDAGIVSFAMHGLHGLWLMPLQIVVALLLLYSYLGPAVLMTLAVITAVTLVTAFANKLNLAYQAWEDTFGGKVRDIRREELGWLAKIMLFMCANTVVFSSGPLAMTVLVFGIYIASGGQLDAGKVFTATAFFGMLEGPMQNFLQTIVMSMQAFVSLDRLNKFLTDAEIDTAAVDHIESGGSGDTVAVKNGQGNGAELVTVLRGIDVEVRSEITAMVGTVGSGASHRCFPASWGRCTSSPARLAYVEAQHMFLRPLGSEMEPFKRTFYLESQCIRREIQKS
ncbi:unnamed protein product [Miscanthus lutarioriparius]|uniref:ABC transmembrane type-1 domain-containing protein n=1 Tax=Miscanthus lutarioriparius TaxID=422564 RepID=A0A811QSP0_9POAL|nr:unnamed protein product [Miscanthus lutarioriparius]